MRIAVYSISLNEELHIKRWYESASEADVVCITDTGSTDNTVSIAESLGIKVSTISVKPWRFDVARNCSLSLVPDGVDMCIALDLDEVLVPGWRDALESLPLGVTRPRYRYTWSWKENGTPDLVYMGDKIHSRHGYRWKHPVHEVVVPTDTEIQHGCDVQIHHLPDGGKPRLYLDLLELSVKEDPNDDRNAHYLAREYFFAGKIWEATKEFKRHLSLPSARWAAERARSMRYLAQCEPDNAEHWLLKAIAEDTNRRENWVDLANYYYRKNDWPACYAASVRAMSFSQRNLDYMSEGAAWGGLPYDLAAVSSHYLGLHELAVKYNTTAMGIEPLNERLMNNHKWYLEAAKLA